LNIKMSQNLLIVNMPFLTYRRHGIVKVINARNWENKYYI
jgi:hypothetical protein